MCRSKRLSTTVHAIFLTPFVICFCVILGQALRLSYLVMVWKLEREHVNHVFATERVNGFVGTVLKTGNGKAQSL